MGIASKVFSAMQYGGAWELNSDGKIIANRQVNVRKALELAGYVLKYDEFSRRVLLNGRPLDDAASISAWLGVNERFMFRPSRDFFDAVVNSEAHRNNFHPVRNYLNALHWDGVPRIDRWLTTYGRAKDSKYTRGVGRLALIAAVRRVRQPGCVVDQMMVLVDQRQGTDKSSALRALCPDPAWFTDSLHLGGGDKAAIETLAGKWIVEASEPPGMRRSEIESLKAFLSRQVDRARRAYDRFPTEAPRQCVFVGTTIAPVFLKDAGSQRYWPVRTGRFDAAAIERDRDHLWAEAAAAEANGESIRLDGKLWPRAQRMREEHPVDPWVYKIERVLGDMTGRIATASLFEILMLPEGVKRPEMCVRLASCMRALGWDNNGGKVIKIGRRVCRGYLRGNGAERWREITTRMDPIARTATANTADGI
jgi:predicted P-loop ATPase